MSMLIVAAHPDDEVLGCGGTIARLASEGEHAHVVILGEGVTARCQRGQSDLDSDIGQLTSDSDKAAEILGVSGVTRFGLADNRFDRVDLLDIVKLVEGVIDDLAPSVVYTQHSGDNMDQQPTFRAILAASTPVAGPPRRDVYAFEVGSSTEWALQRVEPMYRPAVFVDISATLNQEVDALLAYAGEVRAFPHSPSPEAIRAAALRWGSTAGLPAAEAFELVRALR